MKLSSAFDSKLLLNGCTGKTDPVMDEVAAITGDQMSYLDKSNAMTTVENRQDMSDVVWSGVFSLSDQDGVNTIAYGSGGAIYGCYNYSNLNAASYSKSYAGNDIFASAYAVGEHQSDEVDLSNSSNTGGSKTFGVMIGATESSLYIYSETVGLDGIASKTWSLAQFDPTGASGNSTINEEHLGVYNVFSAGRTFFVATEQGLIRFDASDINMASFKILFWEVMEFPDRTLDDASIKNIQFIREKTISFGVREMNVFIVGWINQDGNASAMEFHETTTGWTFLPLLTTSGTLADIVPVSNVNFPSEIKTKSPGYTYPATPDGEEIPWIDPNAVSILPKREVDENSIWKVFGTNEVVSTTVDKLKVKTPDGYGVLALNALASNNSKVDPDGKPTDIDDTQVPQLYSFKIGSENSRTWKHDPLWAILAKNEPLPKHLDNRQLYWVAQSGDNGKFFAQWNESYEVNKIEGTGEVPAISSTPSANWTAPTGTTQLYNDSTVDKPSKVHHILDLSSLIGDDKMIARARVCIKCPGEDNGSSSYQYQNILYTSRNPKYGPRYARWRGDYQRWSPATSVSSSQPYANVTPYSAVFDFNGSGNYADIVSYYYPISLLPNEREIKSKSFGKVAHNNSNVYSMSATAAFIDNSTIEVTMQLNGYMLPFFSQDAGIRLVLDFFDAPNIDFTNAPEFEWINSSTSETELVRIVRINLKSSSWFNTTYTEYYAFLHYHNDEIEEVQTPYLFNYELADDHPEYDSSLIPLVGETTTITVQNQRIASDVGVMWTTDSGGNLTRLTYSDSDERNGDIRLVFDETDEDGKHHWIAESCDDYLSEDKSISQNFVYSYSGILSGTGSDIKGNEISCQLAMANGSNQYGFNLSSRDISFLQELVGLTEDSDHNQLNSFTMFAKHSFVGSNSEIVTKSYPVGTVRFWGDNPELTFLKDIPNNAIPIPKIDSGETTFSPLLEDDSEFTVDLHWTKATPLDEENGIQGTIQLTIDNVDVADRNDWIGVYKEYFEPFSMLSNSQYHFLRTNGNRCVAFSNQDAATEDPLPEAIMSFQSGGFPYQLRFLNSSTRKGCSIKINPNLTKETVSSFVKPSSNLILGASTMWRASGGVSFSSSGEVVGSILDAEPIHCFNFSACTLANDAFVHYDEASRELRTYKLTEYIPEGEEEARPAVGVTIEVKPEDYVLENPYKNVYYVSAPIDDNFPVWIENDEEVLSLYALNTDEQSHISIPDSGFAFAFPLKEANEISWQNEIQYHWLAGEKFNLGKQSADILTSNAQFAPILRQSFNWEQMSEELIVASIPLQTSAIIIDDSNSFKAVLVGREPEAEQDNFHLLSATFVEQNNQLRLDGAMTSCNVVEDNGTAANAIASRLYYALGSSSEATPKIFSKNQSTGKYYFGYASTSGSIPYVQYDSLKQMQWNETIPKKIVQWIDTPLHAFILFIQDEYDWVPADERTYDATKAYSISTTGGWPEFWPTVGTLFFVNQDHMTDDSDTKYTQGRYVYIGDGRNLAECYAKLPYWEGIRPPEDVVWTNWISNDKKTHFMAIGSSDGGSYSKIAEVELQSDDKINGPTSTLVWKDLGPFRMNGIMAVPSPKSIYSAIPDPQAAANQIYLGIEVGNVHIAVPKSLSFTVPRLCGLFSTGQSNVISYSDAISDLQRDSIDVFPANELLNFGQDTSILSFTTRLDPVAKSYTYSQWAWEASLAPYAVSLSDYGTAYVVGAIGILAISKNGDNYDSVMDYRLVYAKSLSKGALNAGSSSDTSLPLIYPPYNDISENDEDREAVFYDEYGFHVKTSGFVSADNTIIELKQLSGTDSMSSISTIKAMTTFKAYNAPIVVGLYEKGGLILYYGTKCFDRSILTEDRYSEAVSLNDDTAEEEYVEDSFDDYVESQAADMFENGGQSLATLLKTYLNIDNLNSADIDARIGNIVDIFIPSDSYESTTEDRQIVIQGFKSDLHAVDNTARWTYVPEGLQELEALEEERALTEMEQNRLTSLRNRQIFINSWLFNSEMAIIRQEKRSHSKQSADIKFVKSYEYSVNNSTESQWINIPIYVKKDDDYVEVTEELATLSTCVVDGRIRLIVGSSLGNVYWRDLNPLHADKYISYIPTGMLPEKEQAQILSQEAQGIPSENEWLKEFLDGVSKTSESLVKTARIGWTEMHWLYSGNNPIHGEMDFLAKFGSKTAVDSGTQKWLFMNGKDMNVKLSNAEASIVQNSNTYAPYVGRRTQKWIVGGQETSVPIYANEPLVKKVGSELLWCIWDTPATYYLSTAEPSKTIPVVRNEYPHVVTYNGGKKWAFGDKITDIDAVENGRPYISDEKWVVSVVDKNGKSKMQTIAALPSNYTIVQTIEQGPERDEWAINGRMLGVVSNAELTPTADNGRTVSFTVGVRSFWALKNVATIDDPETTISIYPTSYSSDDEACPYSMKSNAMVIIDTLDETPIWTSTSQATQASQTKGSESRTFNYKAFNNAVVESDSFYLEHGTNGWSLKSVDVSNSISSFFEMEGTSTESSEFLPYYIGKTGKEWWLLPNIPSVYPSRIGPYTSDAEPTSEIGSRWTITQRKQMHPNPTTNTFDTFDAPQGTTPKIDPKTNKWMLGSWNTGYDSYDYEAPICKCSIWKWKISSKLNSYVSESSECPYVRRPEYGLWSNGFRPLLEHAINENDVEVKIAESTSKVHWWVNGYDTGIQYDPNNQPIVNVVQPLSKTDSWEFIWSIDEDNQLIEMARTTNSTCPLKQGKAMTWWVVDKDGVARDTGEDALDPVSSKGLEADGIASREASRTIWNEETKNWVETEPQMTSWTPLASLFVDAYQESSYGILESIKNPWSNSDSDNTMKKGMVWEMETSESIFGEEGVHISDVKTNSWDAYKEGEGIGNSEAPAFAVYIGWKVNANNPVLYDSYCTIVSLSTGAKVRWQVPAKEWRFLNLELVTKSDGTLNNIVILSSRGWIVSSGHFSLSNGGKEIKSVVWNTPCNPVAEVLNELEKINSYKWNSWASNHDSEFAAVGSFGVYVYSEDCITFKASIPYGQDATLSEVVWDSETEEFKLWGVAPKVQLEDDESQTVESGSSTSRDAIESSTSDDDFESAYEKGATNANKSPSISVTTISDSSIYKHKHQTVDGTKETLYYTFSKATTSFDDLDSTTLSSEQKEYAVDIVPDSPYKFSNGSKSWTFIYSKCRTSNGEVLGSGFNTKGVQWRWMWSRKEEATEAQKLSYITISKNRKAVAYGFPDLVRFIRSYKNTYTSAMEFVGAVCQFANSERESANSDGKSLKESYKELVSMGGMGMYSTKLNIAYGLYEQAEKLRDASHYVKNDCYNTYLQKIGQSLALEYQDYFNRAKRAMWTAQAFRNYYDKLAKQGREI